MKSTSSPTGKHCTLATREKSDLEQSQLKLPDRYIVVCPVFFNEVLDKKLQLMDMVELRDSKLHYNDSAEDVWLSDAKDNGFYATIWKAESTGERFVYVDWQGRLFSCDDMIQAGKILEELKAHENLKIIS